MSRTPEEWFALGDDFGVELAKVFGGEPYEHDWFDNLHEPRCSKCQCDATSKKGKQPCPVPDPIDTEDWNVAMKWRDKIRGNPKLGNVAFFEAMEALKSAIDRATVSQNDCGYWATIYAKPRHYLIAAAIAMEKK